MSHAASASSSAATSGAGAAKQPNVIDAVRFYIDKMIRPKGKSGGVPGMKVLLMDAETVSPRVREHWRLRRPAGCRRLCSGRASA